MKTQGSCFCSQVHYEIDAHLGIFQYCHCSRCRKFTGSAHSANLLVRRENFRWTSGSELVQDFIPPDTKYFSTAFCRQCGSSLPWKSKNGKLMVVPAGSLDAELDIKPQQNVFCASRPQWYRPSSELPEYATLPGK